MLTAIWNGNVSFGLVTIPVGVYPATFPRGNRLHLFHAACGGRVRVQPVCELDRSEVVDRADITRGYPLPDGSVVIVDDRDMQALPAATARTIGIEAFVPQAQIDRRLFAKPYYLAPTRAGAVAYRLLRDVLSRTGRAAVVRLAIGGDRERLALISPRDDRVLLLHTMLWPDELRAPVPLPPVRVAVGAEAQAAAAALIDAMTVDFHPEQYRDHYRDALDAVIDAKVQAREAAVRAPAAAPEGRLSDLMAALTASIDAAKAHPTKR